ncbi:MAG: hypothetical protein M0036_14155 [Desulfobacteraceae bacterium]|nr:hypothetical protein [Desulfobacteraceae bacterium]
MTNYLKKYKSKAGACASCRHVRTRIAAPDFSEPDTYLDYNGGKNAACPKTGSEIIMRDVPRMDLPVLQCWEPKV